VIRIYLVLALALSTSTTSLLTTRLPLFRSSTKILWEVLLIPAQYRQLLIPHGPPPLPGSCSYPRPAIPPTSFYRHLEQRRTGPPIQSSHRLNTIPPYTTTYTTHSAGQCHRDSLLRFENLDTSSSPHRYSKSSQLAHPHCGPVSSASAPWNTSYSYKQQEEI
jgi:hypothetical protein